jgi:mannose/fructose/N-acetylgalactosamine-specific phosphotransferase system component IIB
MVEAFRKLIERGVRLEVRTHPRDASEDLMKLL